MALAAFRIDLFGMEFGRRVKEEGNTSFHETFGIAYSSEHKVIFLYLIALVLAVITALLFVAHAHACRPRLGSPQEDEIAARSLGLSRTAVKLSLTIGAFFAGFAGTVFASKQGFISPESFVFWNPPLSWPLWCWAAWARRSA